MRLEQIRDFLIPPGNYWFYVLGILWWVGMFLFFVFIPIFLMSTATQMEGKPAGDGYEYGVIDWSNPGQGIALAGEMLNYAGNLYLAFMGFLLGSAVGDGAYELRKRRVKREQYSRFVDLAMGER